MSSDPKRDKKKKKKKKSKKPKGDWTIDPTAVVCEGAKLRGTITIGARTVIHPKCTIDATAGPIEIGADNLIEEQVIISTDQAANGGQGTVMHIGDGNYFEVGAEVHAVSIGSFNVFGCKCKVGTGSVVESGCVINPLVEIGRMGNVEADTVVFGQSRTRRKVKNGATLNERDLKPRLQMLSKVLKSTHKMVKVKKKDKDKDKDKDAAA